MRTWLLLTSLAFSLPLAACGDDTGGAGGGGTGGGGTGGSDATTSTTGDTTTTTTTSTGGSATVESVDCAGATIAAEIATEGFAFSPTAVTIAPGDVIRFTPESSAHNISGDGWSSEFGATECFSFPEAGSYDFVCDAHSNMTGTVTVE